MDLLRRHAFLIVCALLAVAGIGLIVTGARAMPKVVAEMQKGEGLYRNLVAMQTGAVNYGAIEAAEARKESVVEDRDKVFNRAREIYGCEPLVPGALPAGNASKRLEFRLKYIAGMDELLDSLHGGRPADRTDYADFESRINVEEAEEREAQALRGAGAPAEAAGPAKTRAGVLTRTGAKRDARARASLAAAQKIYIYTVHYRDEQLPDLAASLDVLPAMQNTSTIEAPELEDVWWAQVNFWIQRDVVKAIASLNDERARQIRDNEGNPWVGVLPIKEVISVRVQYGFVPAEGEEIYGAAPGGHDAAMPPGTSETVFTGSKQSGTYEVVQFTVKLIADIRDLPALIDRICKNRFHTLLRVSYEAVPANRDMVGKIYGSDPVVNVVMDFETILLGDVFRQWMPKTVCETFVIDCPEPAEPEEGD